MCFYIGMGGRVMGVIRDWMDVQLLRFRAALWGEGNPNCVQDAYWLERKRELARSKADTAVAIEAAERLAQDLQTCNRRLEQMQHYAEKALLAGNEADAKKFLIQKVKLSDEKQVLEQSCVAAASYAAEQQKRHDRLAAEIEAWELQSKRP